MKEPYKDRKEREVGAADTNQTADKTKKRGEVKEKGGTRGRIEQKQRDKRKSGVWGRNLKLETMLLKKWKQRETDRTEEEPQTFSHSECYSKCYRGLCER